MNTEELKERARFLKSQKKGDDLYLIQASGSGMIKIGRSKHPYKRIRQLQTGNSNTLRLIHVFEGWGWREPQLHEELKEWRIRDNGEWFHYDCIGSIPEDFYELVPYGALDDWWRS